jgi:hypothetical protein
MRPLVQNKRIYRQFEVPKCWQKLHFAEEEHNATRILRLQFKFSRDSSLAINLPFFLLTYPKLGSWDIEWP